MRYKDAVQQFVDMSAPLLDRKGSTDAASRYILLDVFDVLYHQGVLDESPLVDYSDGLGPFGQNILLWTNLENSYLPNAVDKGLVLWKIWESGRITVKALESYVKIIKDLPLITLSRYADDPGIAISRLIAQTSYRTLAPNPVSEFISEEEHVIKVLLGSVKFKPAFPMSQTAFRVQQQLLGVLTKSSDLNYLYSKIWLVNTRLYFTVMAWKYLTLTGECDMFSPLLSIFNQPGNHHV